MQALLTIPRYERTPLLLWSVQHNELAVAAFVLTQIDVWKQETCCFQALSCSVVQRAWYNSMET
jgi:hypothetical protein